MDAVLPVLTSFAGIALGWYLNQRSARGARAEERAHQERLTLLDRQEQAAARFHEELTRVFADLPRDSGSADVVQKELRQVHSEMRKARVRAGVLVDREVERRFEALDTALYIQQEAVRDQLRSAPLDAYGNAIPPRVDTWILAIATGELLDSLVAVQRREQPAPAVFPSGDELNALAYVEEHGRGLAEVGRFISERIADRRGAGEQE